MFKPKAISIETLRQLLDYEPSTGKLYWRARSLEMFNDQKGLGKQAFAAWNTKYAGKEAFTADCGHGYRQGAVLGKNYYAHRVAWAIATGSWPTEFIDHINGDRSDNRIINLREATKHQNTLNTRAIVKTSAYKGVSFKSKRGKWVAQIRCKNAGSRFLGEFEREEDAAMAYKQASIGLHGEYSIFKESSQ